jgi:hypothetical protein
VWGIKLIQFGTMDLKKYKNTLFYLTVTGGFTVLIYWIITKENCWREERT